MNEATATVSTDPSPTDAFIAIVIWRAHSSGSESRNQRVFLSLEGARKWLMDVFHEESENMYWEEEWDEEDMGCPLPVQEEVFDLERIKKIMEKNRKSYFDCPIWGPESQYEAQVPFELFLKEIKIYP